MWVFLPDAFLSVVQHRDLPNTLLVRSRTAKDILSVFPSAEVQHTPDADYPYRAVVDRQAVAARIAGHIIGRLDYDNFKGSIPYDDSRRYDCYSMVWATMIQMEEPRREPVPYLLKDVQYNGYPKKKKNKRSRARNPF